MGFLKVHIIPGGEIHLEGDSAIVLEILQKYTSTAHPSSKPPIHDSIIKSQAKTESEWLLVYASYANTPFTRHDLLSAYKQSGRYSPNRTKNLSFNLKICIKHNWFTALSSTTYSVTTQGQLHFQEILARNP